MMSTGTIVVPINSGNSDDNSTNDDNFKDSYAPLTGLNPCADVSANTTMFKGEAQPKKFHDIFFGMLFYAHLIVTFVMMGRHGSTSSSYGSNVDLIAVVGVVASVCSIFAAALGTLMLGFMMEFSEELVKTSLIFSVCMSFTMGIACLMWGQILAAIMGFLSFAFGVYYACIVQDIISFAVANLNTAITAVKINFCLFAVAGLFLALGMLWNISWSVTTAGVTTQLGGDAAELSEGTLFLFLLSYYWTFQVLQNFLHVTTAGAIGSWWFPPIECSSCCSSAVTSSFKRATTFSFGSICFGSLLVAIVQALRTLRDMTRHDDKFELINCMVDCILGCIESIIEYLTKWAYMYVTLYGYSYLEAGRNVITLFQNRDWTAIITDDLVDNALLTVSLGVGLATGLLGALFARMGEYRSIRLFQ